MRVTVSPILAERRALQLCERMGKNDSFARYVGGVGENCAFGKQGLKKEKKLPFIMASQGHVDSPYKGKAVGLDKTRILKPKLCVTR